MEIDRILTVSTAHLSQETCNEYLPGDAVAYPKGEYGWFIAVPARKDCLSFPRDLRAVLGMACMNDCQWLCLDRDGDTLASLPTFEW